MTPQRTRCTSALRCAGNSLGWRHPLRCRHRRDPTTARWPVQQRTQVCRRLQVASSSVVAPYVGWLFSVACLRPGKRKPLLLLSATCPFLGRFTRCARLVARRQTFVRRCQKRGERRDRLPLGRHLPVTASKCGGRGLGAHHTHHAQDPRLSGADVVHGVPDGPVKGEKIVPPQLAELVRRLETET
jgi:hypothetical protein